MKNAFTLIELLAVIVILAIISLIAIPIVTNIIENSKNNAFIQTANGIIKAGEYYFVNQISGGEKLEEDKIFTFPNSIEGLEFDGEVPNGTMVINKKGEIAIALNNGRRCVMKQFEDNNVIVTDNIQQCFLIKTLSEVATISDSLEVKTIDGCAKKGITCTFGKGVENPSTFAIKVNDVDIYKFYVINDDGKEVTLIMDRNLYSHIDSNGGNVSWISESDYIKANVDETICTVTACNDEGPITVINELVKRTASWTNISKREYLVSDDGGYDRYTPIKILTSARLLTHSEAISLGCQYGVYKSCPYYLYQNLYGTGDNNSHGYFTSTASNSPGKCFHVGGLGDSNLGNVYGYSGVRPVITLLK